MSTNIPNPSHVFIRGEGGSVFKLDLPLHETIQWRLARGYLTVVDEDGNPVTAAEADVPSLPTERPAVNAPKSDWIGWAVTSGLTPDQAEALTKTDLIERFGADPKPQAE